MPPAGLLAIIAIGLVLAYVLPQRIRERSDYALVRTEDRYSAEMRVVRSTAARIASTGAASASAEHPLLVTGAARVRVAQAAHGGHSHMSRPNGPLDRAAAHAQRESLHLRRDRLGSKAQRTAAARRRAFVASVTTVATVVAWVLVAATGTPALIAAVMTGATVAVVGASVRAAAAERKALARIQAVDREVKAAATALRALQVVSAARASGQDAHPSDVATQAIRIVTARDLAPLTAPAMVAPGRSQAARARFEASAQPVKDGVGGAAWRPKTMPVPAYALKASVRQQTARQLSEDDYAASSHATHEAAQSAARVEHASDDAPRTGALDAILAKRRQASA